MSVPAEVNKIFVISEISAILGHRIATYSRDGVTWIPDTPGMALFADSQYKPTQTYAVYFNFGSKSRVDGELMKLHDYYAVCGCFHENDIEYETT